MPNLSGADVIPLRGDQVGYSVAVVGLGTTGAHVVKQLLATAPESRPARICLVDKRPDRVSSAVAAVQTANTAAGSQTVGDLGEVAVTTGRPDDPADLFRTSHVAILATDCGSHSALAIDALRSGCHVVSMSDNPDDVDDLLALDSLARYHERTLVVGAGMVPGLSCLLARFAGDRMDSVHAINVAKAGTAGPACARQHHRALKSTGRDWVRHRWEYRRGGSGRDLAWFPEPIGPRDCYRGGLPSPTLLQRQFPDAQRISARVSATRRDRFTSRLPMLRKPHHDGGPGAVRVEVRGRRDGAVETIVLAVAAFPSESAAAVSVEVALSVLAGMASHGSDGLASWSNPGTVLSELRRRGVAIFAYGDDQFDSQVG